MRSNKVRTSLTILGVVIGIASVIIVFSAGEGISQLIIGEVESFGGPDMIETEIKVPSTKKGASAEQQSAVSMAQGVQITTLTIEDMEDVARLPNIKNSYAGIMDQEQVSYGNEMQRMMIMGVSASFVNIDKSKVEMGRFFEEGEDKSLEKVVVLGSRAKEKLFGDSEPIGQFVKIRKEKFRVVGIMEERGAVMGFDFDNMLYMPIRTLQKRVMGIDHILYIMHQVHDQSKLNETAEDIRGIIRNNHDIASVPIDPAKIKNIGEDLTDTSKDDFRTVTMVESLSILSTVTGAITLLLLAIVAVSLVVGGVGIMNIMYVTVTERTTEIGLRKAVGAKYSDIMWQFLIEAILTTLLGGAFGIIVGIILSFLVSVGASSYGLEWEFTVPLKAYLVSIGFSTAFGLIFGLYPARKAAKLDPIKALISE